MPYQGEEASPLAEQHRESIPRPVLTQSTIMHFIRRAAFRAATSPSTSFISKPRSINTSSPFALRSKSQNGIPSIVFRRFASDETKSSEEKSSVESADSDDHGAVRSAIDSATESVSTYAGDAAESLTRNAEQARDAVVDSAAAAASGLGFSPREDRRDSRPSYGDRAGRNDRPSYGGDRDAGRGFGDSRRPASGFREPMALTPCPNVYIGNLLFDVTASDLEREFGEFGTVKSAVIAADARGLSKGFGYVQFETTAQAAAAIEAKHQTVFEGRRLVVNYQSVTKREYKENPPSKTLFIGNLAFEMSDADLNKLFRDIRNVIDVRVAIDRRTGQPRGFAHADFVDVESAIAGKAKLGKQEIYGRQLRVDFSAGNGYTSNRGAGGRDGGRDDGRDDGRDGGERQERY
ncbi:RNA-binding 1 2 3 [Hyphodiscus hymeniophilus]|uniref:RNA-binding 1 2 3 n=1 Tax=Hyphodiscus hymeniophilus TaxID=353542 RepID=A0A9P6VH90_9HELO|nr:RNA-binding 1 2 3 [Hyphodiscus hymeniophilus]